MPSCVVTPLIDPSVRKLCVRSYPRHKRGCPNFNKKNGCPPHIGMFHEVYDLNQPVLAVWNIFDFKGHVEYMKANHPDWSQAQLENCLYWQGKARKSLRRIVTEILKLYPGIQANYCPEAMGVNITETMKSIGVVLEWPPVNVAIQVALLAYQRGSHGTS